MRTVKAQISLRIRAVWSGQSLSAYIIIGYYRMYEWSAKARMILCACAACSKIAHLFEGTFSLDAAMIIYTFCPVHAIFSESFLSPGKTMDSLAIQRARVHILPYDASTHEKGHFVVWRQRWSGPSLSAYRISGYLVYVDEQKMPRLDCTGHAELDLRCPKIA